MLPPPESRAWGSHQPGLGCVHDEPGDLSGGSALHSGILRARVFAQSDHAVQFIAFGTLIGFVVTAAIVAVVWWLNRAGSDWL